MSPRARLALIRAVLGLGLGAAGCAQIFGIDEANAVPAPTDAAGDARHAKDAGSDGTKPAHDAAATKDATKSDAPAHHDSGRDAATDSPTKIDAQCTTPGTSADSCGTTCTDCTATAPTNETAACNAGACSYSCQFTMCPVTGGTTTVCSDPKTDPLNCGACGQSCLGGACSNGACQPVVLASRGANTLLSLAVDSTNVYWTENEAHTGAGLAPSDVVSCAKGGCDGGTVLFTERSDAGPSQLMGIATSADASTLDGGPANLYVAGLGGLVLAVPTSGGTATTLATGLAQLGNLVGIAYIPLSGSDNGYVFTAGGTAAYFVPTADGGCGAGCFARFTGLEGASGVAADTQNVYIAADVPGAGNDGGATLYGVGPTFAAHGHTPFVGVAPLNNPVSVYSDGTYVWTAAQGTSGNAYGDGQIVGCPIGPDGDVDCTAGNTAPTLFATVQSRPFGVISDGTNVYWVNGGPGTPGNGSIAACTISTNPSNPGICAGSGAQKLVSGLNFVLDLAFPPPTPIAQDAYAIYWIDNGQKPGPVGSRVMKLAKPATLR